MRALNIYEWMLLNGERLAEAIKADGRMCGPLSDPMLTEAQMCDRPAKTFHQARRILRTYLDAIGSGHLLPEER